MQQSIQGCIVQGICANADDRLYAFPSQAENAIGEPVVAFAVIAEPQSVSPIMQGNQAAQAFKQAIVPVVLRDGMLVPLLTAVTGRVLKDDESECAHCEKPKH